MRITLGRGCPKDPGSVRPGLHAPSRRLCATATMRRDYGSHTCAPDSTQQLCPTGAGLGKRPPRLGTAFAGSIFQRGKVVEVVH
jgi:hypothetical protein